MTGAGTDAPAPRGGAPDAGATRTAWLLFAPPFGFAALRWWTRVRAGQEPGSWQRLRPADVAEAASGSLLWQASQPFVLALLALALAALLLWLAVRRVGWARVRPLAAGAWIALWLAAAAATGAQHVNRAARQALPAQIATVLQARAQAPTGRGPGGAEVLLRVPGFEAPQSVLLELAEAAALPAGSQLRLALARGRFGGHYVTGWQPAPR